MSETKSEAFHRLASRRVEDVEDKLRIFSNLSGPSYEWAPAEVTAYVDRIQAAVQAMLGRFAETKPWQVAAPAGDVAMGKFDPTDPYSAPDDVDLPESDAAIMREDRRQDDGPPPLMGRQAVMAAVLKDVGPNEEALVEMVAMQREVIANLQAKLDGLRAENKVA